MTFDASTYRYDLMAGLGDAQKYPILVRDIPSPAAPVASVSRARILDLVNRPHDSMAGLGGGRIDSENFAARKDGVPKRGETVAIRIGGVRRPVTIDTIEELRDGSGFNLNGTLPNGDRVEGFVALEDMTLVEESPGEGRNKVAKSAPFRAGDRVRIREHQVVRVATLDKIEPTADGQLYIQAHWLGGATSGLYSPSQLSPA